MLLLPESKAIFLHIPKTGGQTIESLLGVSHQRSHHALARPPEDWQEWFRFAFVRHPLERFVSACNFNRDMAQRHARRYRRRQNLGATERFRCWLLEASPSLDDVVEALCRERAYRRLLHFRPQSRWLGRMSPQFIGRHETFAADLHVLLGLLNRPAVLPVPHGAELFRGTAGLVASASQIPRINRSSPYYTATDLHCRGRRRLARLYRQDFQRLGYRIQLSA